MSNGIDQTAIQELVEENVLDNYGMYITLAVLMYDTGGVRSVC